MLPEQYLEPSIIFFRLSWDPNSCWTKVRFDGAVLSNLDIKRCIMQHENLLDNKEIYDLVLTNMQTGEEFRDEGFLIPRNSVLLARKIPCTKSASERIRIPPLTLENSKKPGAENIYGGGLIMGRPTSESDAAVADFLSKGEHPAEVEDGSAGFIPGIPNPSEDISNAFSSSGHRFAYRFDPQAKPPPGYICHRCEKSGHFIRFCPTNEDPNFNFKRIKPASGIPVTYMRPAEEPKSAAKTPEHEAPPLNPQSISMPPNQHQFARSLAETGSKAGPDNEDGKYSDETPKLRKELMCSLCKEPFVNAVMVLCCFSSFCDVCIRLHIGQNESAKCPSCGNIKCSKSKLKPNLVFQKAVDDYIEKHPQRANSRILKYLKDPSENLIIHSHQKNKNPELMNAFSHNAMLSRAKEISASVPPNITCFRCGRHGHYMAQCTRDTLKHDHRNTQPRHLDERHLDERSGKRHLDSDIGRNKDLNRRIK